MKNAIIKIEKIYKVIILIIFALSANLAFGDNSIVFGTKLDSPLGSTDSLWKFALKILDLIAKIGYPIIILALIYSGFLFVKAQGKPEELKTARNAILWTIVGALVILGAQAIGYAIKGTIDTL